MALIINTADYDFKALDNEQNEWVYNALDCSVTSEVWEEMTQSVADFTWPSYHFVRGMQGPALCMALRGMKIDMAKRAQWVREMQLRVEALQKTLDIMAEVVWDQGLNPRSPAQLIEFFYGRMRIPQEYKYDKTKKERVVTADRNALEKIKDCYFHARPLVNNILRSRELTKKISTLQTGVDSDARMRTSYNVCGTETGRWSSNENAFGTGTNFQNWNDKLREIFIADPGMKMTYIDLEQAESRVVAYLSGDQGYINACEGGDLHTTVARMVWPELPWTGDLNEDKKIAGQKFYRDFTYRDLAKRGGHGTNYRGKPRTMAMHLHVETKLIDEFQERYFSAFPGIPNWHQKVATELQLNGFLTTPLGRTRYFLNRLDSDDTLKEAIAFLPQSTIGEILNEGMYQIWRDYDDKRDQEIWIQLLAQVHDAVLIQYPDISDEHEQKTLETIRRAIQVPIPFGDKQLIIPANVEGTGWNWRKFASDNHNGLKKWTGHETRQRVEENTSLLARFVL